MSDNFFIHAYKHTDKLEGGFVEHPADRGLATKNGISLRFLKLLPLVDADINGDGHIDEQDIRGLSSSHRIHIFKKYFWDFYNLDQVRHKLIAIKLYDTLVHMRSITAVRILQRALRACEHPVVEDGLLGPQTFGAVNDIVSQKNLLAPMRSEQWGVCRLIIANDSSQSVFSDGWKFRSYT